MDEIEALEKEAASIDQNMRTKIKTDAVIWLTGLSGSGKSTIAEQLGSVFEKQGVAHFILDGDKIRKGLCSDLGFSPDDRTENIRRIGEVSKLFLDAGVIPVVAFISPYRSDRDQVRQILKEGQFIEVFIDCPLEECERRDPKGLYKKVRKGEIPEFTGISAPYEKPLCPEVHVRTDQLTIEECLGKVLSFLNK